MNRAEISSTEEQRIREYSRYISASHGVDQREVEAATRRRMREGRAKRLTDSYAEVAQRLGA